MQTEESRRIVERFFLALETLKRDKAIRGKQTFTNRYGINRRNLYQLERDKTRDIFQVGWLTNLVTDYGVSSLWLLTGCGEFYTDGGEKTAKKLQE